MNENTAYEHESSGEDSEKKRKRKKFLKTIKKFFTDDKNNLPSLALYILICFILFTPLGIGIGIFLKLESDDSKLLFGLFLLLFFITMVITFLLIIIKLQSRKIIEESLTHSYINSDDYRCNFCLNLHIDKGNRDILPLMYIAIYMIIFIIFGIFIETVLQINKKEHFFIGGILISVTIIISCLFCFIVLYKKVNNYNKLKDEESEIIYSNNC